MKKILTAFLVCLSTLVYAQSTTVVISQVYGAGGNAGALLNADYVELHNVSSVPQSLSGYAIQYGSGAANNFNWSSKFNLPDSTIPVGGYFLIRMTTPAATGSAIPTPDLIVSPDINMGGSAGKLVLTVDTNRLISGACPAAAQIVDFVGYGTTAACSETSPASAPSSTLAIFRGNNGCTDTDNNSLDFATSSPSPRNSGSSAIICGTPTGPTINTSPLTSFGFVCLNLSKTNSFVINGTNLTTANIDLSALNGFEYSLFSSGPFSTSLSISQPGGSFSDTVFVKFTPVAASNYSGNIFINGAGLTAPVNVIVSANGLAPAAPTVSTKAAAAVTGNSATLNGQVVFINCDSASIYGFLFDDNNGFSSADTFLSTNLASGNFSYDVSGLNSGTTYYFKAFAQNANGRGYDTAFKSFTTTQILPPGGSKIRVSQVYGAGGNTGALYKSDYVELHNIGQATESIAGFSLQYASATGTSWQVAALPSASIPAGGYFLVRMSLDTSSNGQLLPTPDHVATGFSGLGGIQGKIALVNGSQALSSCTDATIIDFVGYGAANCSEGGAPVDSLRPTTAAHRKNFGCTDTDNNKADFDTLVPAPRNSASALYFCGGAPNPTLSATALNAFGAVCVNTTAGPLSFDLTGSQLTADNIKVAALTGYSYSIAAAGTYTDSLILSQPGGAYLKTIFVKFSPTAAASYNGNIVVTGGGISTPLNVAVSGSGSASASPTVTTKAATAITKVSAALNASLVAGGCSPVLHYGFTYADVSGFTPTTFIAANNLAAGNYSAGLSGLQVNKVYYFKAYAATSIDTFYGIELSFKTLADQPTVTTTTLNQFTNTCVGAESAPQSFKLIGKDLTSASVQVGPLSGFVFSVTSNGTYTASLALTLTIPNDTVDVFVKFVPTAANNYAGNIPVSGGGAAATSVTAAGQGINTPPSVTTGGSDSISTTTAKCSGTIDDEGCAVITERGIEYSTIQGFSDGSGTLVKDLSVTGSVFSVKLNNLTPNKDYYYKAYAKNANGSVDYGDQETFKTSELPGGGSGLTILTNPVSRGGTLRFSYAPPDIDRYIVRLYNSIGQIVFEKTFDNQQPNESRVFQFLIPGNVGPGLHTLLIGNSKGNIKAQIMVL
jgi:hypothetical protein